MTLPNSGPLTLSDIAGEFGGGHPIALSNYYAGGPHVPSGTSGINGAVPTAGALALSKFYGTSNFIPHADDFSASGTVPVPGGSVQLILEAWGKGGDGGNGATGGVDHQGGGGGSGSYSKSIIALTGDAGKTLTINIAAGVVTTSCALTNGGAALTANPGFIGSNATGTTNGNGSIGGSASGGNTTNTTGNTGVNGNNLATGGQGGAAINGFGQGGQGGFTISNTGRTLGGAAHARATWS